MLGQLTRNPAYEGWVALLREMRSSALEELARVQDPGEFRFWQGVVSALGEILDRPGRIIAAADAHRAAEEEDAHILRPELRSVIGAGFDADGDV